jgi:hypothetical protein
MASLVVGLKQAISPMKESPTTPCILENLSFLCMRRYCHNLPIQHFGDWSINSRLEAYCRINWPCSAMANDNVTVGSFEMGVVMNWRE